MQITIRNLKYDDLILRDMGDDYMFLEFDYGVEGRWYWSSLAFEKLWRFAKAEGRPEGAYFDNIRTNVKGFGPKHTPMFDVLMEEGFDFEPLLLAFLYDWHATQGKPFHEANRLDVRPEETTETVLQRKKMKEKAAEMTELVSGMKSMNMRSTAFQDRLLDVLNDEVVRAFPAIINSDPEHIRTLHGILVDKILDFSSKIVSLAIKAEDGEK